MYYTASVIITLCRWPSRAQVLSQPVYMCINFVKDHDFLSSFRAILAAFVIFFFAFLHPYLINDDHYVTRYSMPSSTACSSLLRTQRCHLVEVRSTTCSILVVLQHHLLTMNLLHLPITYSMLDTRYLRYQCLPPRKHSTVIFETEVKRQWLPWQPGCNTSVIVPWGRIPFTWINFDYTCNATSHKVKVKQSRYRSGLAQRVPGN